MTAITLLATTVAAQAHNKVVVIPFGEDAPTHKVVFVTKTRWNGNLQGPTGADQKCMDESLLPGSKVKGRQFKAWIAGASFPTSFQLGTRSFTRSTLPYRTVTGVKIADDYTDLLDGTLDAPINISPTGSEELTSVWTGVRTDGFIAFAPTQLCYGFNVSSGSGVFGIVGHSSFTGAGWTGASPLTSGSIGCGKTAALYCFEQ